MKIGTNETIRLDLYYNKLTESLMQSSPVLQVNATRISGHDLLLCNPVLNRTLSFNELTLAQKRFGHSGSEKLFNLPRKALVRLTESR